MELAVQGTVPAVIDVSGVRIAERGDTVRIEEPAVVEAEA
jgi:hypothetical protein